MKPKKPFPLYPPEFLAAGIVVGDWVYLKAFDTFGKVEKIIPRVRRKDSNRTLRVIPSAVGVADIPHCVESELNTRTHISDSPLIQLNPSEMVSFKHQSGSYQFCAAHCQKLTKELIDAYIGDIVRTRLVALQKIPL